jgi:geranylgeranyl pyrophosphate synthase
LYHGKRIGNDIRNPEEGVPMNFHLTASEKKEVNASLKRENNVEAFKQIKNILEPNLEQHANLPPIKAGK